MAIPSVMFNTGIKKVKQIRNIFVIVFLAIQTGGVSADTLLIQSIEKNSAIPRPDRGVLMAEVEREYGRPVKKYSAIGTPPITRWVYADITVYFENERVIHSVVNREN